MSNDAGPLQVDISAWVAKAKADPQKYRIRQATEILLTAIGLARKLKSELYLKGGILMAIAYESERVTGDVDFSWLEPPTTELPQEIEAQLNAALKRAAAELGYTDTICQVQTIREEPRAWNKGDYKTPALCLTIGFAERGTPQEKRLIQKQATDVLRVDISFKEPIEASQELILGKTGLSVNAYALSELIAEKLRAQLQQTQRKHARARRQDIYDISLLLDHFDFDAEEKKEILDALITKSRAREIFPNKNSLSDPMVIEMAKSEWHTMQLELEGELPTFEKCFEKVNTFYTSLPWDN